MSTSFRVGFAAVCTALVLCLTPSAMREAGTAAEAGTSQPGSAGVAEPSAMERDREAILAMAGAFKVEFRFEESVARDPGYTLAEEYNADATELVLVIADERDFISMQHLLVLESGFVVKHWRQDWRYEDTDVLEYRGHETWEHASRDVEEVRRTWTQAVFQTTDAPRYEAVGTWTHIGDQSSWESEVTWRPLPRRERRRGDYHVIVCRNRHTITPTGWVHEQDNQKVALADDGTPTDVIAHEIGVNTYEHVSDSAVTAARDYWSKRADAWAHVRAAWQPILSRQRFTLRWNADGELLSSVVEDAVEDAEFRPTLQEALLAFVVE